MTRTATHSSRYAMALLASTILMSGTVARAQDTASGEPVNTQAQAEVSGDDQEIIVTANKRAENLQDVPIAITAITTKALDDLQVNDFADYASLVPSLSYKGGGSGGGANGPGNNAVYFRGVASGENGNHSSSLPSVGTYLDEQPITTIAGALDVHVFDLARIEALAGPQGTLYGASSQSGTIRLITNRPDLSATYGQVNVELNKVAHGEFGYGGEGFVNLPVSGNAAARIVGWYRRDGGYIDNIPGTMTFTTADITIDNDEFAEDDYNDVKTVGARAALRIDLDDQWTLTPAIMGQRQVSYGSFAEESGLDDHEVMQFNPEKVKDRWYQAALTVEGKLGTFDITYAGAYMRRRVDAQVDYADYSYFYDNVFLYEYPDDFGALVDPNQRVDAEHLYTKLSQELRLTSPADRPLRLVAGLFYQRQTDGIEENYIIDNIGSDIEVPGTVDDIWLTRQKRVDRDYAVFGELSYDLTSQVTVTAGGRFYRYNNSLVGFFGFASGTDNCFADAEVDGSPCTNVDKRTKDNGFVHRLNATYKPNDDLLLYATWSRGFRPGGINRRGTLPPYDADFLTNYEAGAKYSFGRGAHFNITGYRQDWEDIQLSFLGQNGLTEIRNAGNARIWGVEADLLLRLAPGLTWATGIAYNDAKIVEDFCKIANDEFDCTLDVDLDGSGTIEPNEENVELAPSGRRLPITAKWKGNSRVRYEWNVGDIKAHVQGVLTFESRRTRDIRTSIQPIYGDMDGYAEFDFATGLERGDWSAELYVKNLFDTRGEVSKAIQCLETTCGDPAGDTARGGIIYTTYTRPRTIGLRIGRKF